MSTAIRLLLVEFLFDDPYGRDKSEVYPFFLGQARSIGLTARWVFSGIYSRDTTGHLDKHTVFLSEGESKRLVEEFARFRPTHVIFSEALAGDLEARLAEEFPTLERIEIHSDPDVRSLYCPAAWLPKTLGLATARWADEHLADAVSPEYDNHLIPPPTGASEPLRPYISIIGGPVCLYGRKLARNPFYKGVDLPGGLADIGCAFCRKRELRYRHRTPPVELALRQCQAAASTNNRFSADTYLVRAALVARRIGQFMRAVLDSRLPPSRFLFSYRVDELLGVASDISDLLPLIQQAGHTIRIYNPGIENFSPEENGRFNKGISPEQVDEAVAHIRRWTRDFPTTFSFESFGMILYTPWTSLQDVEINYSRLRNFIFPEIGMEWQRLRSKLQILPETAISRLAARDGALVDGFDGFFFWDGRCLGDTRQRELPWRFLDAHVADYYEVVWRLTTGQEGCGDSGDELSVEIQQLFESRPDRWVHVLDFLLDALDVARESPPPDSPREIVERLRLRVPEPTQDAGAEPRAAYARPSFRSVCFATTRLARLLVEHTDQVRRLMTRLEAAARSPLPGWRLSGFDANPWSGIYGIDVELEQAEQRMLLHFLPADVPGPAFMKSGAIKVWFDDSTPLDTIEKERGVRDLCRMFGRYFSKLTNC